MNATRWKPLAAFFALEAKVKSPLLPLRLITDRVRAGSYITQLLVGMGIFGMFLFMTFYFQEIHGFSAVKSGLCFLPFSLGIIFSAGATSQLLPKIGPRPLATLGCVMASAGLLYLSTIQYNSGYVTHVMPAMIIMSLGLGIGVENCSVQRAFRGRRVSITMKLYALLAIILS